MNWIQVVYIKLKQIWSLFAPAKAKKRVPFFFFWMKAIPSQNLALKLAPNDNYFIEELEVVYFTLKEILPLFAPAKAKKSSSFFFEWKQISVKRPWS